MDYTQHFQKLNRKDGKFFYRCLKIDAPDQLRNLISEIHMMPCFNCLPNEWIYDTVYDAFSDLALDDLENITIKSEVYTNMLIEWLNNHYALGFCDHVLDNIPPKNMIDLLSEAQKEAKTVIYDCVNDFLGGQ